MNLVFFNNYITLIEVLYVNLLRYKDIALHCIINAVPDITKSLSWATHRDNIVS